MSNPTTGTAPTLSGTPAESIEKILNLQVELLNISIKTASALIGPLGKASVELAESIMNSLNQAVQAACGKTQGRDS
ncbi:MAG: hypothetical protein WCH05_09730 [Chlorobiaceae bacterium]